MLSSVLISWLLSDRVVIALSTTSPIVSFTLRTYTVHESATIAITMYCSAGSSTFSSSTSSTTSESAVAGGVFNQTLKATSHSTFSVLTRVNGLVRDRTTKVRNNHSTWYNMEDEVVGGSGFIRLVGTHVVPGLARVNVRRNTA